MFKKASDFYKSLTFTDFIRKVIFYLCDRLSFKLYRKLKAAYYFKNSGIKLGSNVKIHGLCYNVSVGKNVSFYDNSLFEFGSKSHLVIGDECVLSYGVLIAVNDTVTIGDHVQIGEYTSVRDTTHRHDDVDKPMKFAGDVSTPIAIGNDVWIGRGCIIQPGTIIENGVVIGANSVVKGTLMKNGIYAGSPAKLLKMRAQDVV
ncbi:MAG: acyltransferase [Flavipsychrobacter sp.]|nr:acyltransferase [Flavipsychrobacter sp.]